MPQPSRTTVLKLALAADVDVRTARKALRYGPGEVRGRAGERLAAAMVDLGIVASNARAHHAA